MDVLTGYHRWAAEALLLILFFNLTIPHLMRADIEKMILWVRIGYFLFWAFWTAVAFAGLITWIFTHRELPLRVIVMIVASLILPAIDGYRAIKLKRLWLGGNDGIKINTTIVIVEIVLTLSTFAYGLYGA